MVTQYLMKMLGLKEKQDQVEEIKKEMKTESSEVAKKMKKMNKLLRDTTSYRIYMATGNFPKGKVGGVLVKKRDLSFLA